MKLNNSTGVIYCLYPADSAGAEQVYIQKNQVSGSPKRRIDLFQSERAACSWLEQEKAAFVLNGRGGVSANYGKLLPGKISLDRLEAIIRADEQICCLTFIDENCVRRLYFRDEFSSCCLHFAGSDRQIDPEETLYAVVKYGSLGGKDSGLKPYSYITYPEIGYALFTGESCRRASEFLAHKADPDCYLEPVTLAGIYQRVKDLKKDPGSFIFCQEKSPHYILRRKDLRRIVAGSGF